MTLVRPVQRTRRRIVAGFIAAFAISAAVTAAFAGAEDSPIDAAATRIAAAKDVPTLVALLGDDDFRVREAATAALMSRGAGVVDELRTALESASDPEIQVRLRFIIENVVPPTQAALVLRSVPAAGLRVGDLITHLDGRRVRDAGDVRERLSQSDSGAMLRIRRDVTPLDVGPAFSRQLPPNAITSYEPRGGDELRRAVMLYADGFAEEAYEVLRKAGESDQNIMISDELRAIMSYTAGDAEKAKTLLNVEMLEPPGEQLQWTNPSGLDLSGPLRAPLYFEQMLLPSWNEIKSGSDPDLAMQRVYIPGNRTVAAAIGAATLWWNDYRQLLTHAAQDRRTGNMLAIVAWMFHDLELRSECVALIEPRSGILGHKWIRVQSDAWPLFLSGDAPGAVNRFYADAMSVLQNPIQAGHFAALTKNSDVAAEIAFFLYQTPDDPRLRELIALTQRPEFQPHEALLRWSLFSVTPRNAAVVLRDLLTRVNEMPRELMGEAGWALSLLAYADPVSDALVFAAARERILQDADPVRRTRDLAFFDALLALREERFDAALVALERVAGVPGAATLTETVKLLKAGAKQFGLEAKDVLVAVPLGKAAGGEAERVYCVLSRDRRLLSVQRGRAPQLLEGVSSDFYPGPACWPWLSYDSNSGRAWLYDRRRVLEVGRDPSRALKLNLKVEEIELFERVVSPVFELVADGVLARPRNIGEDGEYLRADVKANRDFVSDPDLPEIGAIEPIEGAAGLLHFAVRGGPQMLIDSAARRVWSSDWFAEKLALPRPPTIFPQAAFGDGPRTIYLFSDQGLIEFLPETESVRRIALPGDNPHPPVIPESCPYPRRDPRWLYIARLPDDGGKVYRMDRRDGAIQPTELVNVVQPRAYYRVQSRGQLRREIDARMTTLGIPNAAAFIQDAITRVREAQAGLGVRP